MTMNYQSILTEGEIAELSKIHYAAHKVARRKASESGEVAPCWLSMSDEARQEAITNLCRELSEALNANVTLLDAVLLAGQLEDQVLENWRLAEAIYKKKRASGDARAHFAV